MTSRKGRDYAVMCNINEQEHQNTRSGAKPEAVARQGAERDDHRHGRDDGGLRLREGGYPPGDSQNAGPDHVFHEVEDRHPHGDTAAGFLLANLKPFNQREPSHRQHEQQQQQQESAQYAC